MKVDESKLRIAGRILSKDLDKDVAEIGKVLERNAALFAKLLTKYGGVIG